MSSPAPRSAPPVAPRSLLVVAWLGTLAVSFLPNLFWLWAGAPWPSWLFPAKLALLAALVALGFVRGELRPLRAYFAILGVLFLAEEGTTQATTTPLWQGVFGGAGAPFGLSLMGIQARRLAVSLVVMAALLLLRYRPADFFLRWGQLDATAAPIPLLMKRPEPWTSLGRNLALFISLGTLAFLLLAGQPSPQVLVQALPLLPVVLVGAVLNAFNEEMSYRAALLAPLHPAVGKDQALLLTAALFGLGHYTGVPYGLTGVLMAGVLGWLLGKSMLETRGFFWAWFIHFLQDVMIFAFMGIGSVVPGGG